MITFIEKLAVEIVINLCVGAVLGVISAVSWTGDDAIGENRRLVCRRCASNASIEAEPDQVRLCDEDH